MAGQEKSDRRSRRSRRLIVDALLALMREKRYDRITVQEIIDRADVGRSTFYAQFRNKEDVLESEFARVLGLLHEQHLVAAKDPADQLLPSLGLFRHVQEHQRLYPALVRGLASDPHYMGVHRACATARRGNSPSSAARTTSPCRPRSSLTTWRARSSRWCGGGWTTACRTPPEQMEAFFQELAMPGVRALLSHEPRCDAIWEDAR